VCRSRNSQDHAFAEATRGYIKKFCNSGDLVIARGRLKQNSFQRDGETVYTVDLNCDDFSILAQKIAAPAEETSAAASKPKRK
jgi:single-strand DNA-binding protein